VPLEDAVVIKEGIDSTTEICHLLVLKQWYFKKI
jgi:hypothetical protein